jgi:hypothetical protein
MGVKPYLHEKFDQPPFSCQKGCPTPLPVDVFVLHLSDHSVAFVRAHLDPWCSILGGVRNECMVHRPRRYLMCLIHLCFCLPLIKASASSPPSINGYVIISNFDSLHLRASRFWKAVVTSGSFSLMVWTWSRRSPCTCTEERCISRSSRLIS